MAFILPDLPYDPAAFGEVLSTETFGYHHGKHHKAYVDKTNALVAADSSLQSKSLLELIQLSKGGSKPGLFNQVGQVWNHSFYWLGLSPVEIRPSDKLQAMIDRCFGSTDKLIEALTAEAVDHFGSGWAALVLSGDDIVVTSYHDADTPVAHGAQPLFILDVWEHAYYIDYRNARPKYAEEILTKAIDWGFVSRNLDGKGASRADQPA